MSRKLNRRELLTLAGTAACSSLWTGVMQGADRPALIVDTHQHLWDLSWQDLPWLQGGGPLAQNYTTREYLEAIAGWNVKAVYMEVDVAAGQKRAEVEHVVGLARDPKTPTVAAVVGGRPGEPEFAEYVKFLKQFPEVKGVRQVLHGGHPAGYCLKPEFVKSIQLLGEQQLSFDLCMRPEDLANGLELTRQAPGTRYILDHCGNIDPLLFQRTDAEAQARMTNWKRNLAALAERPNVICKISGVIASVPEAPEAEVLAPVINFCLETFGPERVVFGSDWPVCLKGAPLATWLKVLSEIIAERPTTDQQLLWSGNAIRFYGLKL